MNEKKKKAVLLEIDKVCYRFKYLTERERERERVRERERESVCVCVWRRL